MFTGDFLEPYDFNIFDNHLFYTGVDENSTSFTRLYRTNGDIGNIAVQQDIQGNRFDIYEVLGEHLGSFYFFGNTLENPYELWKINSAEDMPVQISNFNDSNLFGTLPLRSMREIGNSILFDYNEEIGENRGKELWITDGTPEGTDLFIDINPNGDGFEYWVAELDNILYFAADNGIDGRELWRTDGSIAGTFMVKDINPSGDGLASEGYVFNNKIYFVGQTDSEGRELWVSDGTEEGTQLLIDINTGGADGLDYGPDFTELNDRLYFLANDGDTGEELWSTDGTSNGTNQIADLSPGTASSQILNMTAFLGRLYFGYKQDGTSNPCHLWATDGTEAGTVIVGPDVYIDHPRDMFQVNNELVFLMNYSEGSRELWRTDGTDSGTYEILPQGLENQWQILGDGHFAVFGGRLYLDAALNGDADLWSYRTGEISSAPVDVLQSNNIKVYPNPSNLELYVDLSSITAKTFDIQVFDILGKEVLRQTNLTGEQISISKNEVGTGVFILWVNDIESQETCGKFKFVFM